MKLSPPDLIDTGLLPLVDATRAFYETRAPGRGPSSWDELQAFRAAAKPPVQCDLPALVEIARSGGYQVPVRIVLPASGKPGGVLLNLHGGGFYMGSAADDVRNRELADAVGMVVVSLDYRLAPEHPWPAAPDDCETVALWLTEHASSRFGTSRLAIGGFSAGSTLAVTTLVRLRNRGISAFDAAVLQFGTYDLSAQTPAGRLIADEYFIEAYAGTAPDRTHPDLSPIYADLSELPPALIIVGEDDVLLHDNLAFATRLMAAGVEVELRVYPAAPHAFTNHPTPIAQAALEDLHAWLKGQLATR
ncbi:MAG: alpha/beta hydrolase [Leucobacter sp.]